MAAALLVVLLVALIAAWRARESGAWKMLCALPVLLAAAVGSAPLLMNY